VDSSGSWRLKGASITTTVVTTPLLRGHVSRSGQRNRRNDLLSNVEAPQSHSKISYSELTTLLRCSQKHSYAYRQGLISVRPPSYFSKGKLLHEAMATWLSRAHDTYWTPASLWNSALARFQENGEQLPPESDIEQIRSQFISFVKQADMTGIEVLGVEEEFYADLGWRINGEPVLLHGVFDTRLRDVDTGETWVVEHKTAGRAWSESQFTFDFQGPLYIEAVEALTGERPIGLTYNMFLPKAWNQQQRFVTPSESAGVLAEVQKALELRESGIILRQPHWACADCSAYKSLCSTELLGGDSSHLRQNLYVVDEEKAARFAEVE
jgi:hypothetical protein